MHIIILKHSGEVISIHLSVLVSVFSHISEINEEIQMKRSTRLREKCEPHSPQKNRSEFPQHVANSSEYPVSICVCEVGLFIYLCKRQKAKLLITPIKLATFGRHLLLITHTSWLYFRWGAHTEAYLSPEVWNMSSITSTSGGLLSLASHRKKESDTLYSCLGSEIWGFQCKIESPARCFSISGFTQLQANYGVSVVLLSRSQWPRCLRHDLPPLARTLGSWFRIPLKTWMFVCAFILCLCCPVCR
jgi:hypothetical protein